MSDQADLNNVLDDINGISVCLMMARDEFKQLHPPESNQGSTAIPGVLSRLNEAMMLVDDAMAIIVDEIGGVFENEA
tara:strand:+ start:199 stop:429 length:231 start_codon:yes stop_codon:yes gene_type:complete